MLDVFDLELYILRVLYKGLQYKRSREILRCVKTMQVITKSGCRNYYILVGHYLGMVLHQIR